MRARVIQIICLGSIAACQDATKSITEPAVSPDVARIVGNTTVMRSGRVLHAAPPDFVETSRYTQVGTRIARGGQTGCRWWSSETLTHGQHVRMYVAEFDPKTCEFVIARSTISEPRVTARNLALSPARTISGSLRDSRQPGTESSKPSSNKRSSESTIKIAPTTARMNFTCDGGSNCANESYSTGGGGTRSSGFLQDLYTTDPVGWMVTEDYNHVGVAWDLQSGCLTYAQGIHGRYWDAADTNWHAGLHSEYFREFSCLNADNITTSYYSNQSFCDPYEVDVDYYNRVTAHPGGDYGYADYDDYIDIYDDGWCQGMLTPQVDRA